MHACGHDGHTAMGLTVAKILAQIKEQLHGQFKLIFQPAEEGVRGAKSIALAEFLMTLIIFLRVIFGSKVEGEDYDIYWESTKHLQQQNLM